MLSSLALLVFGSLGQVQSVPQPVAQFISQFSLAATEVELTPDSKGAYSRRNDLARTLLSLARSDEATVEQSFALLDKNRSMQRLVAGDLLLVLIFDVPKGMDWRDPAKLALRSVLVPTSGIQDSGWDSPTWPWISEGNNLWKLGSFSTVATVGDKSLAQHLKLFGSQFQRRKFESDPLVGS